jgi:hypothetical protein
VSTPSSFCLADNSPIESFNSRIRDEYLNGHLFELLLEVQVA